MILLAKLVDLAERSIWIYRTESSLKVLDENKALTDTEKTELKENKIAIQNLFDKFAISSNSQLSHASFQQQQIWLVDGLEQKSTHYNMSYVYELRGDLNLEALQQAIDTAIDRHPVLQTIYTEEEGDIYQVVRSGHKIDISCVDYSSENKPAELVKEELEQEAKRPFKLTEDLMLRVGLYKLDHEQHILSLAFHHIAFDEYSMGVFIHEVTTLYNKAGTLPELSMSYSDYAQWQRKLWSGDKAEQALSYWRTYLDDCPELHNIPLDKVRPEERSFRGKQHYQTIDPQLFSVLNKFVAEQNTTMFAMLQAAFTCLLSRYSAQDDIVIGVPVANRDHPGTDNIIGFLVNMLVLRTDLSQDPSFLGLIGQCQKNFLQAYDKQLPFERLVTELKPRRNLNHNPLYQVSFAFQNQDMHGVNEVASFSGVDFEQKKRANPFSKFDISLSIMALQDTLELEWEYAADLFDSRTVESLSQHFITLLQALVASPGTPVSKLSLLKESEETNLLSTLNPLPSEYARSACIHELFVEQVDKNPDAIALVYKEQAISYAQLNIRSNRLAHYLREQGVTKDTPVGVCVSRSPELIVATLGILKAGGAYVPLDPAYPESRLDYMVRDSGISLLLTQKSLDSQFKTANVSHLCLDEESFKASLEHYPEGNPVPDSGADFANSLAYIIYTSGSTGQPKGVLIEHGSVVRLVNNTNYVPLSENTVLLHSASITFDATTFEVWGALLNGGRLVLYPDDVIDISVLSELIQREEINTAWMTARLFDQFVELSNEQLPSLQYLLVGGDIVSPVSVQKIQQRCPDIQLINGYGPTENTTFSCCYHIPPLTDKSLSLPIGKPIANSTCYVLNKALQPSPLGVPGELYVGGDGLARGYLNKPELTLEKFIKNPFSDEVDSRLYKTGDLVRYLPDGNIEFLSRIDNQLKIRGFRIEPGEIEIALLEHEFVQSAVVVALGEPKQLVAYVVVSSDGNNLASERMTEDLRSHLKHRLPEYMQPALLVFVDAIPLTVNGKVNHKALPEPDISGQIEAQYQEPRTEAEKTLCDIWQNVLRIEKVGINHNFFEVGGDSLLSLRVISKAKQHGLNLTPAQLFKHPTVGELARLADSADLLEEQEAVTGLIQPTPGQAWFYQEKACRSPDPHWWNVARILQLDSSVAKPELLTQAMTTILEYHDILRARFIENETGWQQTIVPIEEAEVPFSVVSISGASKFERDNKIRVDAAQAQKSLNLEKGPIFRVVLYDCGPGNSAFLLMVIHHLVADEVALQVILEDLFLCYRQLEAGKQNKLPPKSTSVKVWGDLLQSWVKSDDFKGRVAEWRQLPWNETCALPVDFPENRNNKTSDSLASVYKSLNADETAVLLNQLPSLYKVQVFEALLTALTRTITKWNNNPHLIIETVDSGRNMDFPGAENCDLSRTAGWLATSNLLFLTRPEADDTATALQSVAGQLKSLSKMGIANQMIGLTDSEEFQGVFPGYVRELALNYTSGAMQNDMADSLVREVALPIGDIKHPACQEIAMLACHVSVLGKRLFIIWKYSKNLHKESTIKALSDQFVSEIQELISHCRDKAKDGAAKQDALSTVA